MLKVVLMLWLMGQPFWPAGRPGTNTTSPPAGQSPAPRRGAQQVGLPSTEKRKSEKWHAAVYEGLVVGKSTRSDMIQVLGPPEDSHHLDPEGEKPPMTFYFYLTYRDFYGKLIVIVDRRDNTIFSIEHRPESLSKEEAIKHFGKDYSVTRYDSDDCFGEQESAPLYESPTGTTVLIEYRKRGIVIVPNYQGKVDYIMYVSRPVGAKSPKCKRRDQ